MRKVQTEWNKSARIASGGEKKNMMACVLQAIRKRLLNTPTQNTDVSGSKKRRRDLLGRYDIEADGFVTDEKDLIAKNTNFAEGFMKKDKPFLEGYVRGLDVALKFLETEDADPKEIRDRINNISITLQCEIEWLF